MQITVDIPDEFVERVTSGGRSTQDTAVESLGLEAYRRGRLSEHELQIFLNLASRFEVERLLKEHGVSEGAYNLQDWQDDEVTARRMQAVRSAHDAA